MLYRHAYRGAGALPPELYAAWVQGLRIGVGPARAWRGPLVYDSGESSYPRAGARGPSCTILPRAGYRICGWCKCRAGIGGFTGQWRSECSKTVRTRSLLGLTPLRVCVSREPSSASADPICNNGLQTIGLASL